MMNPELSNENTFENAISELFLELGYDCYCGYDIERDEHNPLYMDELIDNIYRIYLEKQLIKQSILYKFLKQEV